MIPMTLSDIQGLFSYFKPSQTSFCTVVQQNFDRHSTKLVSIAIAKPLVNMHRSFPACNVHAVHFFRRKFIRVTISGGTK